MGRKMQIRILLLIASMGAALAAGSAHKAYPELALLPPLFGYVGGFLVCYAAFGRMPRS